MTLKYECTFIQGYTLEDSVHLWKKKSDQLSPQMIYNRVN